MKNLMRVASVLIVLGFAQSSAADPIRIVAGALVYQSGGAGTSITLTGDSEGFTLQGGIANHLALGPVGQCIEPECIAGATVTLRSGITEIGGQATFQGQTYNIGGVDPASADVLFEFDGSVVIPNSFAGGMLTAPFTFSGFFAYPGPPNNTHYPAPPLVGQGIASVTFVPWGAPEHRDAFIVSALRFDFNDADPVPEPASVLLVAAGLAAGVAARRRRRVS